MIDYNRQELIESRIAELESVIATLPDIEYQGGSQSMKQLLQSVLDEFVTNPDPWVESEILRLAKEAEDG